MTKVQAWEKLHDSEYSSRLSMEGFYDLLITAGYSEKVAQKAANERGWQRLQAGVKV